MKKNAYEVEKNIEKILSGNSTGFLSLKDLRDVQSKLKRSDYNIFLPYEEAEKVILYNKKEPRVFLVKIGYYEKDSINHASILGSLFGLSITSEMFGDIVLWNGEFYVYFLEVIREFIFNNFVMAGNTPIKLSEVDIDFLSDFRREYAMHEIIVSSLRIDTIIARLIGCNRDKVKEMILDKLVIVNGDILNKVSYVLREGDIFSIRRFGKYRFSDIKSTTKKGNFVVIVKKYI